MRGVQVVQDGLEWTLSSVDRESMARLREAIGRRTPVLTETFSRHGTDRSTDRKLFIARGTVTAKHGRIHLGSEWTGGIRGYAIPYKGKDGETYRLSLVRPTGEIAMPFSGTSAHYNEGTFSPSGGHTDFIPVAGGTTRIVIGAPVTAEFPRTVHALDFLAKSIYFNLSQPYSQPSYCIYLNSPPGVPENVHQSQVAHDSSALATANAVRTLLTRALREQDVSVWLQQLGRADINRYHDVGIPADNDDFSIQADSGKGHLGLAKIGRGCRYGDAFLYPYAGHRPLFERAFAKENVTKIFPL